MNRMAARNCHGTIPCGVPSPPGESPNLASELMMAKRYPAVPFRHRTPAPGNPNHVCRQDVQSRCRRFVSCAKMRAVADLRTQAVDAMNGCDHQVLCHRYARLRPSHTAGATEPLSARIRRDLGPLDSGTLSRTWQTGAIFLAGRRCGGFPDPSNTRTYAPRRADTRCLRRGHCFTGRQTTLFERDRSVQMRHVRKAFSGRKRTRLLPVPRGGTSSMTRRFEPQPR